MARPDDGVAGAGPPVGGWLVLPDRPGAWAAVAACPAACSPVLRHASGRAWLIGSINPAELIEASVGSVRLAVIGSCPVTASRLGELAARVHTLTELDALARALPGSWHLLASVDGVCRLQGSLTGTRRVFHTSVRGVTVAGDRADAVARLTGSRVDEQALAARVVCGPILPPPLCERSPWHGTRALPPDHYLRIDRDGDAREVAWWHAPAPEASLAEGAGAVRGALGAAVAHLGAAPGRLGADLSGGIDSTSLCYLAAAEGIATNVLTLRWAEADAANDDAVFAAHAARGLPDAEHLVLRQAELPAIFADPGDTGDLEAPYRFTRTLARTRHTVRVLGSHGVRTHLAGHGGDELFHGFPAYLHTLARRHPVTAIGHVRGYRALYRWRWAPTIAGLARNDRIGDWWHQQAALLCAGPPPRRTPALDWGVPPLRAPGWVSAEAVEAARTVLRETGAQATPLAADRGQHATLNALRMMGLAYRQLARTYAACGVRLRLPYFDDRVVEAALSVRVPERSPPWRYKPLLIEAMRAELPEPIAARTTKGEFGADLRAGVRRHLPDIVAVFADSALAGLGLIDPDLLRRQLCAPQVDNRVLTAVQDLLGCENWLRASRAAPPRRRDHVAAAAP